MQSYTILAALLTMHLLNMKQCCMIQRALYWDQMNLTYGNLNGTQILKYVIILIVRKKQEKKNSPKQKDTEESGEGIMLNTKLVKWNNDL